MKQLAWTDKTLYCAGGICALLILGFGLRADILLCGRGDVHRGDIETITARSVASIVDGHLACGRVVFGGYRRA